MIVSALMWDGKGGWCIVGEKLVSLADGRIQLGTGARSVEVVLREAKQGVG